MWVIAGTKLRRIDPHDLHTRARSTEIGGDPHGMWVAPPCVYVATTMPEGFVAFDTTNGKRIGAYPVGGAGEVVAGAGSLWLTGNLRQPPAILRLDPDSPDEKADETRLSVRPANDALAVSLDGVWTADGTDTVVRVDPSGRHDPESVKVAGQPWAVAVSDSPKLIWVAQRKSDTVTQIAP